MSGLCDSDRIQTCNLLIRSQMLYSVEPRSRLISFAKVQTFSHTAKKNLSFFSSFFERCCFIRCYNPKIFSYTR